MDGSHLFFHDPFSGFCYSMLVASNRADRRRKGEEKRFRQARHHRTAFRPETGGTPAHASKGHRGTGKVLRRRYAAEQGLKCLFAAGFPPGEGEKQQPPARDNRLGEMACFTGMESGKTPSFRDADRKGTPVFPRRLKCRQPPGKEERR